MLYFIDMAINPDHVHLFIQFPPKYSVSFIAKILKGRTSVKSTLKCLIIKCIDSVFGHIIGLT
jgi:REP element-mobilizing transposase RayT